MNNLILHIKTGGTIGGCVPEYKEIEEMASIFSDTVNFRKHITQTLKIPNDYAEADICHKDSRDITSGDREEILQTIKRQHSEGVRKFLITHGTFTMPETAQYLLTHLPEEIIDSSITIITGSMYPWLLHGSDAPMNLGASLSNLIEQETNGVYICMHGRKFHPNKVTKDTENLIFKE